ncbi:hypothetical protein B0J11DRAFT_20359 [Dendryphion nanum]|uniref:Uncharacterized protein n=1 Tax=Dendryphion nanum TaxID=256645 RepID=A0A9P9IYK9_9PLEO|nr:hypothetical protein B0J11DRAFT_20359 [Dendryphion nanum]
MQSPHYQAHSMKLNSPQPQPNPPVTRRRRKRRKRKRKRKGMLHLVLVFESTSSCLARRSEHLDWMHTPYTHISARGKKASRSTEKEMFRRGVHSAKKNATMWFGLDSIQFSSVQFNSIQFNSQFPVPDSTPCKAMHSLPDISCQTPCYATID